MAELLDDQEEKKLQIRLKSQRHIRALLIVVNLVLIAYLLYFIGDIVVDYVKAKDQDIVALCNLSRTKSKKKYKEIMGEKEATPVADYVLYGTYFSLSEVTYQPSTFTPIPYNDIELYRVDDSICYAAASFFSTPHEDGKGLNCAIDLAKLAKGDYFVKVKEEYVKIILGNERWEETIYSLPDPETKLRKKITIYAYPHNPAFVIKIREEKRLPKNTYDLILQGTATDRSAFMKAIQEQENLKTLKIKELKENTDFAVSYPIRSTYAIELKRDDTSYIEASYFLDSDFESHQEEILKLDANPFIRELGGYALGSGSRNTEIDHSFDVVPYQGIHDAGKMAFTLYQQENEWTEMITELFSFLYHK